MKIESLQIKDYLPIKFLKIEKLGDIVIIAGANGSGKTRLKAAIVQTLQGSPQMTLTLRATRDEEIKKFNGSTITVNQGNTNNILQEYVNSRRFGRGEFVGSLVQVDSDRNIRTIKYKEVKNIVPDPDDQETVSSFYTQSFANRWQTFMDDIYKKVAAYNHMLADKIKASPDLKGGEILKKFPHPLEKYKEIFKKTLPGKNLEDVNLASPKGFQYREKTGGLLPFSGLSSGEQEIIKIVFDLAKKDIRHSVIIIDEPELHLHPALTFRLVETLKSMGWLHKSINIFNSFGRFNFYLLLNR